MHKSGCVVALIAFIDIGSLDLAIGQGFGLLDRLSQGVSVVRIAGSALAWRMNKPALQPSLVVMSDTLTPNS